MVVLNLHPKFSLGSSTKVLKAPEVAALGQASDIVRAAELQAAALLEDARSEAQALKDEAKRDAEAVAARATVSTALQAQAARQAAVGALESDLLHIVLDALTVLLQGRHREELINQSLEAVRNSLMQARWVNLIVHPSAESAASKAVSAFRERTQLSGLITVIADLAVEKDGCVIESDTGAADASISTQLKNLEPALIEAARELARSGHVAEEVGPKVAKSRTRQPRASKAGTSADIAA